MSKLIFKALLLRKYLKNLHLDEEKLKKSQQDLIRKSITYALEKIEFYRNYWKKINFSRLETDPFGLLEEIPSINKEKIIPNYNTIIGKSQFAADKPLFPRRTSGTRGIFSFMISENTMNNRFLVFLRSVLINGYKPWQKIVDMNPVLKNFRFVRSSGLVNLVIVPTALPKNEQIEKLKKMNDFILLDEPLHLLSIANLINKTRGDTTIRPKFIVVSGDILTRKTREIIEETFKCKVFESYTAAEFGTIAFECKHHNLHINSDFLILSLSKLGEISITSFDEFFPFIKYEISDIGKLSEEKCRCGITFPCLESVEGRTEDTFFVNRKIITPKQIFQVIEDHADLLSVKIVREKDKLEIITSGKKNVDQMKDDLNELFNKKLRIEIKNEKKFRYDEGKLMILQSY
jgi:phenylacetate-CoA ligase